jgi:hypothetical protein
MWGLKDAFSYEPACRYKTAKSQTGVTETGDPDARDVIL